jgi:hypothetical protein
LDLVLLPKLLKMKKKNYTGTYETNVASVAKIEKVPNQIKDDTLRVDSVKTLTKENRPNLKFLKKSTRNLVKGVIADLNNSVVEKFEAVFTKPQITITDLKQAITPIGGELLSSRKMEGFKGIRTKQNKTIDRRTLTKPLKIAYNKVLVTADQERIDKITALLSNPENITLDNWNELLEIDKEAPLKNKFS